MNHLRTIVAALLFAAAPAAGQTIKTLGYNTTNGNVVAARTNLTFTNSLVDFQNIAIQDFEINSSTISWGGTPKIDAEQNFLQGGNWTVYGALGFNNTTNAAITRTNLGGTTVGNAVFTATNAAAAATAIGLGTTNNVTYNTVTLLGNGDEVQLTGSHIDSISYGTLLSFEERRFAQSGTNIFSWDGGFTVTPAATFNTNVTVNGTLTVKSLATTDPVGWALDAVQTAAATNGVLTLPDAANVLRITNANAISSVTNGRLGAFYYLVNQTTNNLTISNVGGITVQGGTPLTLGANQAATLVATGPTNASVAARGDLTDVSLGGTANTAPNQTASSGSSLMTRDLSDDRYFNQPNMLHINVNNFTGAVVGGNTSGQLTGLLNAQGQTAANTITNSFLKMGTYPAQSGARASFNFSKKMRAKVWFITVVGAGSVSNTTVHYILPTVSGYNAGQPSHKSFGFTVNGSSIQGFAHDGTNYNTTTNSVNWSGNNNYLGVVENNGAGVYSFWVNNNGTYTSLGTVTGPTGTVSAEYLFGANVNSTTTNDANFYYIVKTLDFASEP